MWWPSWPHLWPQNRPVFEPQFPQLGNMVRAESGPVSELFLFSLGRPIWACVRPEGGVSGGFRGHNLAGPWESSTCLGSCWAQVLASPWTPAQRQPAAGRSRGVRGRGGTDAEASGSQGCEGPSGGRASGAAPLTSRAAGPATGCTGCTGCRGSASMGSGCSATDCKTEAGGDPAATRRDPRGLPGAAPRGSGLGTHSSVSAGISNFSLRDFMAAPREPTPGGTGREQTRGDYGLRDALTGGCRGRDHGLRGGVGAGQQVG